jgi:hypothetical protein
MEIYSTSQFKEVIPDDMHSLYTFNFRTHLQQVAISARELNYLRLYLNMESNPYDTLVIFEFQPFYPCNGLRYEIYGNSVDSSILTRCLPNAQNYITYQIQSKQLRDSFVFCIQGDTITTDLSDTFKVEKFIRSAYDIPLADLPH